MSSAEEVEASDSSDEVDVTSDMATEGVKLTIDDIRKTFDNGQIVACEDISLDIAPDDFVVLLGPSGCGKTTTLRCIAGLETPDSGRILIGEDDVTDTKPRNRNLAFVFQSIALFPHMSVRRNMRFGLDMKGELSKDERKARVENVARTLGIEELLDRSTDELSGGQQQRVSIGRAMVMEPAAFLLDEPFSALDANLRDQLQTEVKQLQRELNTAMVFVTHDQDEAMTLGDKIVVMNDGHIQQVGSPYEIYNEPASQFVAEFIGSPSTNFLDGVVVRSGDGLALEADEFMLELSEAMAADLEEHIGDAVTVGVRPEYLVLDEEDPSFRASVEVVEPQGSVDTVHLDLNSYPLRATMDQGTVTGGNDIGISVDAEKIWVFDTNGVRLA